MIYKSLGTLSTNKFFVYNFSAYICYHKIINMPIIDKLDNFNLLRKKRSLSDRELTASNTPSYKKRNCMPTSEVLKECFVASVTHLKSK